MDIDWASFGEVFVVSFGAAVGVCVLFAIGVSLLSPQASTSGQALNDADIDATESAPTTTAGRPTTTGQIVAGLCFLACALTVIYGLFIIISK